MMLRLPCVKMEGPDEIRRPRAPFLFVTWLALPLCVAVVSCSKPVPEPEPMPQPTPVITPHPASGSKEAAIKLYPALAVKDSTFNKTFRDLYDEQLKKNPDLLTRADWPLYLAQRTAGLVGAVPYTPEPKLSTPYPAPTPVAAPRTPTALDRGTYNKSGYWTDRYGVRHYY